ncbi:DUF3326 domain-containing protein [Synechococcus sp. CBW1006]|uniref:DUF3326 domain-containing protein n=1 Tax=Synechococcus sp. CBW1006 TaxID=1353138 RepID=UPI001E534573|nr:DUF3326 domain-containing protein [Synechococcus sp. CBW1006]
MAVEHQTAVLSGCAAPPLPTLLVIPTGVGCAVGGYAGDGLPAARLLAAASGCLITHPNVMNAAALYWSDPRLHYVEGWSLNRFAAGELALAPVPSRRVGLLLDAGIEEPLRQRHLQAADACRASLGLAIGPVRTTEAPLHVSLSLGPSGASWGSLVRPDLLLRAGEQLVAAGATAIAVVARFPDEPESEALAAYRQGAGVDGLAGAEAVISHLLSRHLGCPCAHAPALAPLPLDPSLDPRAAAEELGHTFLPCVLVGLSRAPDLVSEPAASRAAGLIRSGDIGAVVAPAAALGGEAVLACAERGVPVIAVRGNPCVLAVDGAALGLEVLEVTTYAEAAGLVLALREGIDPASLHRPLGRLA